MRRLQWFLVGSLLATSLQPLEAGDEPPRLVQRDGRHALLVDGEPLLML